MNKKGKYKLLSYLVEDKLIIYNSFNKNKKFIGFSIFYFETLYSILTKLNFFLKKRYLNYYSIQLNLNNENFIVLCFEDYNVNKILSNYNLLYESLSNYDNSLVFLKEENLEKVFFKLADESLKYYIKFRESNDSLSISNEENSSYLNYFKIKLNSQSKKEFFINTFLNLVKNFNQYVSLIINFKVDRDNKIIFNPFSIELQKHGNNPQILYKEVNGFFNISILEKMFLKVKDIGFLLWRLPIENEFFYLFEYIETFNPDKRYISYDPIEFIIQIEDDLNKNEINYTKINNKILVLNQKILFILILKVEFKTIKNIIEKFYNKYTIILLIFNNIEYQKILKIKELNSLNKIKIISKEQFLQFNINILIDK